MKKLLTIIPSSLGLLLAIYFLIVIFTTPSNDKDWAKDQSVLPYAKIDGTNITIYNIRNFSYTSTTEYETNYYDKTFDIEKIKSVDYILEPFSDFAGAAHTFLSFGFEGGEYISISVEIRKEVGETFSPLKGLLNQYEIMYVIADERDAVKLRSNYRKDKVYIYPANTTKENMQSLFLDMIERTNKLKDDPEFYNTLTNTCTTNIVRHVNRIVPKRIPFSYKTLMPGYSDELAFELDLIDTDLSLEDAREVFLINERAEKFADDPDFSRKIRER